MMDQQQTSSPALGCLQVQLAEGILTVRLARPDHGNAVDAAMARELQSLFDAVAADPQVRVVILCGAGEGFSVGFDDDGAADPGDAATRDAFHRWRAGRLPQLPQPLIAQVHGFCLGEACGLVDACDIAFAAHETAFALPAVDAGAAPSPALAKSLVRSMAPRAAALRALTGERFDGLEAERTGLVTRSFPAAELERETQALAAELAAKDALALQFTKETLRHVGAMDWDAVLNYNAAKFAQLKALQAGRPSPRAALVESFLAGRSKPGLGR